MLTYINGIKNEAYPLVCNGENTLTCIATYSHLEKCVAEMGIDIKADPVIDLKATSHFESHNSYDFLCVNKPLFNSSESGNPVSVFFTPCKIAIFTDDKEFISSVENMLDRHAAKVPADLILYHFFNNNFYGDSAYLDEIEDNISNLESSITDNNSQPIINELIDIRKDLLKRKRYYEALFDLLQDLEENLNGFISKEQLKRFHIHTNRADRLYNYVNNLREYANQVREAYQNQLDINLNETMKLFTVITAIFLPLTLIAGWFGMNLQMPEFELEFMYPIVIFASIFIIIGLLLYFKKKKWF